MSVFQSGGFGLNDDEEHKINFKCRRAVTHIMMKRIHYFLIGFLVNSVIHDAHVYNVTILAIMAIAVAAREIWKETK